MKYFKSRKLLKWPKAHAPQKGIERMKTCDRFAPILRRVSAPLRETYEITTGTDLNEENHKFVQSKQTLDRVVKLTLGLMLSIIIVPWPLALVIHWIGLINGTTNEILAATILTGITSLCFMAYFRKVGCEAAKVRDTSEAILDRFEGSVRALEQTRYRLTEDRRPFNREVVHENLVAMARDVLAAEGLEKYLHDSGKIDSVNDIVGIANHINKARSLLDNALNCQPLFGLSFTRRGLFREAKAKSK